MHIQTIMMDRLYWDRCGDLVGMDHVEDECLKIENMINDSIEPSPSFKIEVEK